MEGNLRVGAKECRKEEEWRKLVGDPDEGKRQAGVIHGGHYRM